MCLSVLDCDGILLESSGVYKGFEYNVTSNKSGFRCGYVKVLPDHPYYGQGLDDLFIDVHGGLTFAEPDKPCDKQGADDGWWFGFDCSHAGDLYDESIMSKEYKEFGLRMNEIELELSHSTGTIKTVDFVIDECKKMCDALRLAA